MYSTACGSLRQTRHLCVVLASTGCGLVIVVVGNGSGLDAVVAGNERGLDVVVAGNGRSLDVAVAWNERGFGVVRLEMGVVWGSDGRTGRGPVAVLDVSGRRVRVGPETDGNDVV